MPRPKEFDTAEALTRAMDTFWLRGFEGASISELEEAMHIGRGSIYHTFGDKHQLFLAALANYCDAVVAEFEDALDERLSTRQALARLFERRLKALQEQVECRGCFLTNSIVELAPFDPGVAEITSKALSRLEDVVGASLERDRKAGRMPKGTKVQALAKFIVSNTLGITVMSKGGNGLAELREIAKVLLEAVPEE